jgi:sulfite exporter TauE/SafE
VLTLVGAVLVASLLGSLHCAGMCGAIVALAVGIGQDRPAPRGMLHAAYHMGRMASYTLLGAIAGAIGGAMNLGGEMLGLQTIAAWIAAVTIIALAITTLAREAGVRGLHVPAPAWLGRAAKRALGGAMRVPAVPRAGIIGLVTPLLPCGWLYAFAIVAAGTGDPARGAIVMLAFWAGTVPILLVVGGLVRAIGTRLTPRIRVAAAVLLLVLGLGSVTTRAEGTSRIAQAVQRNATANEASNDPHDALRVATEEPPPCCQHETTP